MRNEERVLSAIASLASDGQGVHGYRLGTHLDEHRLPMTMATLYRCLGRLEALGLLDSALQPAEGRGPAKRVFHLTGAGAAAARKIEAGGTVDITVHPAT